MAAVVIKKYGNRRLYDTGESRYVTLEELATKIRGGAELRVVDAQNGEDLTQGTLTQIVLETGHAARFLPVQLLTQMIRLSDDGLAEFFSRYVMGALDVYLQAKRGVQQVAAYNPLAQLPIAASDALARMWMASPFGAQYPAYPAAYPAPYPSVAPPAVAPPPEPEPEEPKKRADTEPGRRRAESEPAMAPAQQPRDDVAAMRRELEELKQELRDTIGGKRRKRRP